MLRNVMTDNRLTLFCLVDGESASNAFPVEIESTKTIGDLKKLIKTEKTPKFDDIAADELTLWRVSVLVTGDEQDEQLVSLDSLAEKKKLMPTDDLSDVFVEKPPKKTVHVIVERPPPVSKRSREEDVEPMSKNKRIRIIEGWKPYKASNGKSVDLPLSWIEFLESTELEPEPRKAFDHLKSDLQAGDAIIIPSMGQIPKDFGLHGEDHTLFVTEQMLELWEDMRGDKNRTYRRVLSGPMGVGKSYLSYFLAARAYAEGWPTLYISDAGILDTKKEEQSAMEVVKRFLAINKDILTAAELETLVNDYNGKYNISIDAISVIFNILLITQERKTLLLVDEHGKLFQREPYVPMKFKSLKHLSSYDSWGEQAKAPRLIFTGTAHAKYEMTILDDCFRNESVLFVGPLSETVFLKLLDTYPRLSLPDIKDEVIAITNCVPRELVHMSAFVEDLQDPISAGDLQKYIQSRSAFYLNIVKKYYRGLDDTERRNFYNALLHTFLYSTTKVDFQWGFVDLGLIYRRREASFQSAVCHILCRSAHQALLELFKSFALPDDIKQRVHLGQLSGDEFEQALFHQLLCVTKPILLNATDLNNNNPTTIAMDFVDCNTIKGPNISLGPGHDKVLCRGYKNYPRFDYMLGPMFFQVSISDFASHNESKTADITKAFSKDSEEENQIERYLNEVYGPGHSAKIDNNRFVVTRDGVPVPGFRIVYIRGSPGKPTHRTLVKKFPDVVHITFEELQEKLFKNIL